MTNKNGVRVFPTKGEFMGNKKLNDIIYGFFQTKSFLTADRRRYCIKSEVTAAKVINYFKTLPDPIEAPASERTIRDMIKLFIADGLLTEGSIDKQKVYFLHELEPGKYVYIKTETLRFLTNTATSNVIKVYAFLKKKQQQHIDLGYTEPYRFSKSKLLEVIGYSTSNHSDNMKMINDILDSLINNGLIQCHREWVKTTSDATTQYFILDGVSEDYIHNLAKKVTDNKYIVVPVEDDDCPYLCYKGSH